jgi:drug/metabolite transporter (DMT)-like permease
VLATLLGLAAGLTYGASDFLGGLASRRSPVLAVVVASQLVGVVVLLPFLLVLPGRATIAALAWGGASGAAGGAGVALLYRGLSRGRMSVVAPTTAVGAAVVPVLFGLVTGERPGVPALLGIGVALAAIVLVSLAPDPPPDVPEPAGPGVGFTTGALADERRGRGHGGLTDAVAAGVAFGAFFILLQQAGADTGLWPLLGARFGSIALLVGGALATGRGLRPAPGTFAAIAGAGALDMVANAMYLLATRHGLLSLVVVLTALYPASTVVLARLVLGERMVRGQVVGLGLAAAGITLIALG